MSQDAFCVWPLDCLFLNNRLRIEAGGGAQVAENFPSKCKALSSNPSTAKQVFKNKKDLIKKAHRHQTKTFSSKCYKNSPNTHIFNHVESTSFADPIKLHPASASH
jgi:hypothetical protein